MMDQRKAVSHEAVPAGRIDDLVMTKSADELLVYDTKSHHIHHLNQTSAAIWLLCDGQRSVFDITSAAQRELGGDVSEMTVRLALRKLEDAQLLVAALQAGMRPSGQSRRSFLRKAAIAGAVPAIVSVTAPTAALAFTYPGDCNQECDGPGDCNNCCSQCNGHANTLCDAPLDVCVHPTYCLDVDGLGTSCNP